MADLDSDILSKLPNQADAPSKGDLNSINNTLNDIKKLLENQSNTSEPAKTPFKTAADSKYAAKKYNYGSFSDEITKSINENLIDSVFGKETQNKLTSALQEKFGKDFNLKDLPGAFGKEVGQKLFKASGADAALGDVKMVLNQATEGFGGVIKSGGSLTEAFKEGAGILQGNSGMLASSLGKAASSLGPYALAVVAVMYKLNELEEAIGPAVEGFKSYQAAYDEATKRQQLSDKKKAELARQRLVEDVNTLVAQPFKILEASATSLTQAFDANLRLIGGTQGYSKSDVQSLMSSYAQRLRSQGLTDIIGGDSLINNLSKVISAGLSGKVAEEFAYQATVLGNAIPSQDFFGYASTYSSIAANAIRQGKSQSEAIEEANNSLHDFANNLLYASRQLAGGYSTGLTNAQSLYEQSVRIAQSARSGNISGISGVMTSVAAIIGATAPDLANAITDAIYSAATGGNASSLVALRSLAGVNASNTEFLRALASDPQAIFSTLFTNLANMYNQSSDAYMEKAEGYAELFGLSSESFQRIDFNYLAQAISQMNINSDALNENMELMVSGETTLTSEQLKNRQINKYMIENGLSYVLDNEAARAIQQHMWDEQLAREQMEATYGVNLEGAALEALVGLLSTVKNIVKWLIPGLQTMDEGVQALRSFAEAEAMKADIQQVLTLGNVGAQNSGALHNLLTTGANLNLTTSLVTQMGGAPAYGVFHQFGNVVGDTLSKLSLVYGLARTVGTLAGDSVLGGGSISSGYRWGTVSKSLGAAMTSMLGQGDYHFAQRAAASGTSINRAGSILEDLLSSSTSYEDFATKARRHGIADLSAALTSSGYDKSAVERYFESKQVSAAAQAEEQYRQIERDFYSFGLDFFKLQFPENFQTPLFETLTSMVDRWDAWREDWDTHQATVKKYVTEWTKYYISHAYYDAALGGESYYKKIGEIQKQEKAEKGDAIYALAEALTTNTTDLRDPAVQTNAILSQILVVLNAIQNQTNDAGVASGLPDTLAALALGGTYKV